MVTEPIALQQQAKPTDADRVFLNAWCPMSSDLRDAVEDRFARIRQEARAEAWQPIETHPITWNEIDRCHDGPRVLVWGPLIGIQMGRIYVYPDGRRVANAEGFGTFDITMYMPLPAPPAAIRKLGETQG